LNSKTLFTLTGSLLILSLSPLQAEIEIDSYQAAYEQALKSGYSIREQQLKYRAEVKSIESDAALRNPEFRGSYERNKTTWRQWDLSLRLPIPNPMLIVPIHNQADAHKKRTNLELESDRWKLRCAIKESFHQAYVKSIERDLLQTFLGQLRKLKASDASAKNHIYRADADLDEMKFDYESAKRKLANQMGVASADLKLNVARDFGNWTKPDVSEDAPVSKNVEARRFALKARESRLSYEQNKRIPWFKHATYGYEFRNNQVWRWNIAGSMTLPLFEWNNAAVAERSAQVDIAKINLERAQNQSKSQFKEDRKQFLDMMKKYERARGKIGSNAKYVAKLYTKDKSAQQLANEVSMKRSFLKKFLNYKKAEASFERAIEKGID
jgi:hypothetical protein